ASFLTLNPRACCFNEQGTGKTVSVAYAASYLMQVGKIKRALIVCPLSIMTSAWMQDLFSVAMSRHSDVCYGSKEKRQSG
ncbi:MAG: SNF2-related protein, partial [Bdellovibrionales bacterium]